MRNYELGQKVEFPGGQPSSLYREAKVRNSRPGLRKAKSPTAGSRPGYPLESHRSFENPIAWAILKPYKAVSCMDSMSSPDDSRGLQLLESLRGAGSSCKSESSTSAFLVQHLSLQVSPNCSGPFWQEPHLILLSQKCSPAVPLLLHHHPSQSPRLC